MKGSSTYKFGQKKVLEDAYGGKVLPFSKTLITYKDVSDIIKKDKINPFLTVKGLHPSVTGTKGRLEGKEPEPSPKKKRGRKKKVIEDEPIIEEKETKEPKSSPKKKKGSKKKVIEDEPIIEEEEIKEPEPSPKKKRGRKKKVIEDEPIIEEEEIKEPEPSPKKKRGRKKKEIPITSSGSPKKSILIKDKGKKSTKKVSIDELPQERIEMIVSKSVNYPKDPFLLPTREILNKIEPIPFPMTNILLYPTKKVIKIQNYGAKDNIGLEKKKEETKAILSVLEKIDYRKLEGYREGNRKIKYLKPELVKFAKELRLPIKTADKRDIIASQIKKKYDASGYSKKK